MSLGSDKTACATQLREAMRAHLDTLDPPAGSNVDNDQVRPNFDALGEGVFQILTADAETISAAAEDSTFWTFVSSLRNEVEALRMFDAGLKTAFAAWDPAVPATGVTLKAAISNLTVPSTTPAAPASLRGKVR